MLGVGYPLHVPDDAAEDARDHFVRVRASVLGRMKEELAGSAKRKTDANQAAETIASQAEDISRLQKALNKANALLDYELSAPNGRGREVASLRALLGERRRQIQVLKKRLAQSESARYAEARREPAYRPAPRKPPKLAEILGTIVAYAIVYGSIALVLVIVWHFLR